MVEYRDVYSSSPVRTPKVQLAAEQTLTGECWIPPKRIPHLQGQRRSPNKSVGGANPMLTRDAWRAQTKLCAHQGPEAPQKVSKTCL